MSQILFLLRLVLGFYLWNLWTIGLHVALIAHILQLLRLVFIIFLSEFDELKMGENLLIQALWKILRRILVFFLHNVPKLVASQ